ncbi:YceI family protein [Mucilaginibacter sp.]|uniref:YceI family protein n=1 Tax=Mucilaginibacter sp. TaxID=1882438 RepID=UPI003266A059
MKTQKFNIESSQSSIDWTGRKVTDAHNGTIDIKEGQLTLENGDLTGGNFVIDTTSIKILDVTDPATNAQFAGHLASDDFFSSEKFPAATFDITVVIPKSDTNYHVEGNLTIKGITEPSSFDVTLNQSNESLTASGKIVIDRTKYGIKFRSGNFFKDLGDNLIYNEFELNVFITAKAV